MFTWSYNDIFSIKKAYQLLSVIYPNLQPITSDSMQKVWSTVWQAPGMKSYREQEYSSGRPSSKHYRLAKPFTTASRTYQQLARPAMTPLAPLNTHCFIALLLELHGFNLHWDYVLTILLVCHSQLVYFLLYGSPWNSP